MSKRKFAIGPIRNAAIATYQTLEVERERRKYREQELLRQSRQAIADISDVLIELFVDFAKDRIYEHAGELFITEMDIREREPNDIWPVGTIRITGRNGDVCYDKRIVFHPEPQERAWHIQAEETPSQVIKVLVRQLYIWREQQGKNYD